MDKYLKDLFFFVLNSTCLLANMRTTAPFNSSSYVKKNIGYVKLKINGYNL